MGIDYIETFLPVYKMVTVRTVLALAATFDWPLYQMDVYNAFLQGDLVEEVYMELPQGVCSQGKNIVCGVQKSLYGLKQASRQWNVKLIEALLVVGFQQSRFDYSMFTKKKGDSLLVLLIYVDDLMITRNNEEMIIELKNLLNHKFKMKDLGELKYFLGLKVLRSREGIVLNQRKYALELIEDVGLGGAKVVSTPLEQNLKLITTEFDKALQQSSNDFLVKDKAIYQRLIGLLLYLIDTRLDISYDVQHLSQFMQQLKSSHLDAALRVVRYVKKDPGQGLLFKASGDVQMLAYCNFDWATCAMSRKSVIGFCIKIRELLVSWKSKK